MRADGVLVSTRSASRRRTSISCGVSARYGSFRRSMALPLGVDPKKIGAKTRDGVVEVTIPLSTEAKKETITITPTVT
jgi:HSP20 family molecular chaperone IbpA